MSATGMRGCFSVSRLHRLAVGLHSGIPRRLLRNGCAFPPLHYMFHVTRRCNLRCAMCQDIIWLRRTPDSERDAGELTTREWTDLIDQTGRFSFVSFTGGEPWVREDFTEILEYASAKRRTHYITNATLLTDARARHSVQAAPRVIGGKGLTFVGVSMHGPRDVHDAISGQEGAFDASWAGITALARYRDEMKKRCPYIHVTTVIQQANLQALCEMPALAAKAGADVLNLARETPRLDLEKLSTMDPFELDFGNMRFPRIDPAALHDALDSAQQAAHKAGIELRLPDMPREDVLAYYDGGIDVAGLECRGAWTTVMVGARGGAFTCLICNVGDCRKQRLKQIWNGNRMRSLRRKLRSRLFPVCQACCFVRSKDPRIGSRRS